MQTVKPQDETVFDQHNNKQIGTQILITVREQTDQACNKTYRMGTVIVISREINIRYAAECKHNRSICSSLMNRIQFLMR